MDNTSGKPIEPDTGKAHAALLALGRAFGLDGESPQVGEIIADSLRDFELMSADDPVRKAGLLMFRVGSLSRVMCERHLAAMGRLMEIVSGAEFREILTEFVVSQEVLGLCPADDETFISKARV